MEPDLNTFSGKRVLITGGGGYLGSKLAEVLTKSNADISLLDIAFNSLSENLITHNKNIRKYHVDVTQKHDLEILCNELQPDFIYHFCALLNRERTFDNYTALYNVNVQGTLNLLEALKPVNYSGLYFSSSSEVYGNKNTSPFHERQVASPASPYSLTKLMAENLIQTWSEINKKAFTIMRIFNFYGPDMPESFFLNQLIATLKREETFEMTGGNQVRDFMHIDDLVSALIAISNSDKNSGETINFCSGKGIKLKDLAIEFATKLNKIHLLKIGVLPYRENEIWEMVGSNIKLQNLGVTLMEDQLFNIANF